MAVLRPDETRLFDGRAAYRSDSNIRSLSFARTLQLGPLQSPTRDNISDACANEKRLAALHQYGVLDSPKEPAYDDITRLAAHVCQVPTALISFVDKDRQWFKSAIGLDVTQTPTNVSICAHALLEDGLFIVPDTLEDERFKNNPLVIGEPHLRFYAGALLVSLNGTPLGTLCVLDYVPRELTAYQVEMLRALARQVMTLLELRRLVAEKDRALKEQQRLEETLIAAKQEADAANKAKDRFFAVLSHELRAPLHPALMISAALATDEGIPERFREDLQVVHRNIELEASLIDSMLDLTRIGNGKLELHVQRLDIDQILNDSVGMCRSEAAAKSVSLTLDTAATQHRCVNGDAPKLQQVFGNLLRNAIKFTPAGGRVAVRSTIAANGALRVEVEDTGVGIDPEVLPRVFEAFEQGRSAVTREYGGLGLGLAICKGIVSAHGGTISAASNGKDTGTTLTVELPALAAEAPADAALPALPWAARQTSLKILLVEDHEDTLRAMARLLRKLEHSVTTATCVIDALDAASKNDFDLVISDLGLPDGTGLELMRSLLVRRPCKGIALTGYGMESDIDSTREAGFAAHLTKPVNFQDLATAIQRISR